VSEAWLKFYNGSTFGLHPCVKQLIHLTMSSLTFVYCEKYIVFVYVTFVSENESISIFFIGQDEIEPGFDDGDRFGDDGSDYYIGRNIYFLDFKSNYVINFMIIYCIALLKFIFFSISN